MRFYLGSDHAGFELKEKIKKFLIEKEYDVKDCGAFELDKNDDYPDFVFATAKKTTSDKGSVGIVFGKSGAGESIVANKVKGIRAILGFSKQNVELSRIDNNTNILSLGSQFINENLAKELVTIFIETKFSNKERHSRRLDKIKEIENGTN